MQVNNKHKKDQLEIAQGHTKEDVVERRSVISAFFHQWKENNPSLSIYNKSLKENILIRFVSITETCTHASRLPESTLAVLHMDAILENARKVAVVKPKNNGNQKPFEKIIVLEYLNNTLGRVRVTVGVKRRTHEKVLYCITSEKE